MVNEAGFPASMKPGIVDRLEVLHTLEDLVALRLEQGLSQTVVAERMGVSQSAVSQFEREAGSVRIETLQRYARAVGARVRLRVHGRVEPGALASLGDGSSWGQRPRASWGRSA